MKECIAVAEEGKRRASEGLKTLSKCKHYGDGIMGVGDCDLKDESVSLIFDCLDCESYEAEERGED